MTSEVLIFAMLFANEGRSTSFDVSPDHSFLDV